jgi:predicted MFS family arabinose efflux permease
MGMIPLAALLMVRETSGSLAAAGAVLGGLTVGSGLGAPLTARWVDRVGVRRPVARLGLLHGAGLVVLVAVAAAEPPTVALVAIALLCGAIRPPILPALRALVSRSFDDDAPRRTGYGMLGVLEEVALGVGPAVAGAIAAVIEPKAALLAAAVAVSIGAWRFAAVPGDRASDAEPGNRRAPLASFAVWMFVALSVCCGVCFGALDVAAAAYPGHVAGALLAMLAVGIGTGSFLFGLRPPTGAATRLLVPFCALATGVLLVPAIGLPSTALVATMLLVGLSLSPVLTLQWAAVDELAPPGTDNEVAALTFTAYTLGAPIGALVGGALADDAGAEASFALAAGALAAASLVASGLWAASAVRRA